MATPERVPFPERIVNYIDILHGLGQVAAETLLHSVQHIRHEPREAQSEHYRGAAKELDATLFDQDSWETQANRWDDMGSYLDRE